MIRGKSAEEAEQAIVEGATKGQGDYVALSVSGMVERTLTMRPELVPPAE